MVKNEQQTNCPLPSIKEVPEFTFTIEQLCTFCQNTVASLKSMAPVSSKPWFVKICVDFCLHQLNPVAMAVSTLLLYGSPVSSSF